MLEEDQKLRTKFHQKICKFYKDFCKKIYNAKETVFKYLEDLTEHEANIWACIYRGINRKNVEIEYEDISRTRSSS